MTSNSGYRAGRKLEAWTYGILMLTESPVNHQLVVCDGERRYIIRKINDDLYRLTTYEQEAEKGHFVIDDTAKLSEAEWDRLIEITRGSMSDEDFRKRYLQGQWPKEGEDNGKRKDK